MIAVNKLVEYLSERLSSFVIILLSLTCAVLAVLLFYVTVPHLDPVGPTNKASTIVTNIIDGSSADVAVYVQIDLQTNSRKFIANAQKDAGDQQLVDMFKELAERTKFTVGTNPQFVYSLISGNVICQDRATISPFVLRIINTNADKYTNPKICTVPVLNGAHVLVGYVSVVWRSAPSAELELATIIQVQSEVGVNRRR